MLISLLVHKAAFLLIPLIHYVAHQHFSSHRLISAALKHAFLKAFPWLVRFSKDAFKKKESSKICNPPINKIKTH